MSVRKVITRSKKSFRVKFPSKKNQCTVHCESILEACAALFLEIAPQVKSYVAQPSVEIFYDELSNPHRYFPDFHVVLIDDSELDIEVKPKSELCKPDIKRKLEAIAQRYYELGRHFRILTDEVLKAEPFHTNLKKLKYHRKMDQKSELFQKFEIKLTTQKFHTIADLTKILGGESYAYDLIAAGLLSIDFEVPIQLTSKVWILNNDKGGQENDPFRL